MSLFDGLSMFQKYSPFDTKGGGTRLLWGKVISNKDPKMTGRIKVAFKELMPWEDREGEEAGSEVLPWIYPLYPAGLGEGPLSNSFAVPEEETFVFCIFPMGSIYTGFYVWQTVDKKRRMQDFNSEYPERWGWQDSRENKFIINKDPEIDTIEQRYADGGLSTYDSKNGSWTFRDDYGTDMQVDRKNQRCDLKFAGCRVQLVDGLLRIETLEQETKSNSISQVSKETHKIRTDNFSVSAQSVGVMSQKFHNGKPSTYETLDRSDPSVETADCVPANNDNLYNKYEGPPDTDHEDMYNEPV